MTPRLTSVPDPQLLSQALAACTVGVVMTDARQHDQPIVYVNLAFEALSGYLADEIIGRNCRFMQGHDRDQPGVQAIRQAMAQGRSTTVTLRNYRKDGTMFYNALSLSPVHDAAGSLTHYFGFQNDVTEREVARQQLTSTLERITDGFVALDRDLNITYVNAAATAISDNNPAELIDQNFSTVFPGAAQGPIGQALQRASATGTVQHEVSFVAEIGRWLEVTAYPAADGVSLFTRDVTHHRQAQEEQRANEERYRRIATELQRTLDLSLDLITSIDAGGRFVTVSAACQQILGYAPNELIGRAYLDFVHPEDRALTTQEDESIAAGQPTTTFQNRYVHKNGAVVWLEWAAVLLAGDLLTYCVARNVTQRRAAEEDRSFLAAIVEASHDSIVGMDLSDTIRSWNTGAEHLYGYTAAEAIGQPIALIIPPELRAESALTFRKAAQGERIETFESVRIAKDGVLRSVVVTVSAIRDAACKVVGLAKVTRDVTALQAAESQVRILNQHLEEQLRHVTGLREIDQAIASSQDLSKTLGMILDNVAQQLKADAVTLLLLDPQTLILEYAGTRGFTTPLQGSSVRLGSGLAGDVALSRKALTVPDLQGTRVSPAWRDVLTRERLMAYYGAPLMAKGKVVGVIEVLHREPFEPSATWLVTFEMLTAQAAIAVDNAQLFSELERRNLELRLAYDETIEGWARALDLRDHETEGHSRRVTETTVALCQRLGASPEQIVHVRRGALLHDIGKMGIRDAVLLKPGPLTDEEWVEMKKHPGHAVNLLSPIEFLRPALDIPQYHHEKWDGSGYPLGLSGKAIPLMARAFAVVDVYDALTSDRPYRKAWTTEQAIRHLQNNAGTHFDPAIVANFVDLLQGLPFSGTIPRRPE